MKALIIDNDPLARQMARSRLEALGYQIREEENKNNAVERMQAERFQAVFIDPAPLTNPRPAILSIRRSLGYYPFITIVGENLLIDEAIRCGANDVLQKPFDPEQVEKVGQNAKRLSSLIQRMNDSSVDYPSAGGVIAKSAFNQLFLSSLDRADRYGERTYLIFIEVGNSKQISFNDGKYALELAGAQLSNALVRLRRQSDIIAQTGDNEYCIMLQRPAYETEPKDAAARFADNLSRLDGFKTSGTIRPELHISLVEIPLGSELFNHIASPQTVMA